MAEAVVTPVALPPGQVAADAHTGAGLAESLFWCVLFALLSIAFTGYIPFSNNNIYHLPILRADYDQPGFADDAFVQSLRHFSSGFWLVFAGSAGWIAPKLLLGLWFVLSRVLMMAAALHLAASLGYRGRRFSILFLALYAMEPLARGYAPGGGGLNIDYFSHSELANAVLVLSLSTALRGALGRSVFLACLTFFLNAFMAVWLAPLWLAAAGARLAGHGSVRPVLIGALSGLPLLVPVVLTVLAGREPGYSPDYGYAAYLRGFFPFHFFLDSLATADRRMLGLLVLLLVPLPALLARHGRRFGLIALAALVLLAAGSAAPLVTENRFILNLHLIRSAVLLQLLAALGVAMVTASLIAAPRLSGDRPLGFLMAALLLIGGPGLPGVLLLLLYRAFFRTRFPLSLLETPAAAPAAAALALIALALQVPQVLVPQARAMADRWALTSTWERAGKWLAAHTPPDAVILPPVRGERLPPGADPRSLGLDFDVSGLVATAGRSLWTNYKFGAAPMWAPSTYRVWRGRYDAALKLDTAADRIAYARQHGIAYVATFCDPAVPAEPAYRDGDLCLYAAGGKG